MDFSNEEIQPAEEMDRPLITKLISYICSFLLSWQAIFRIPDVAIGVILKFFRILFLKLSEITKSEDLQLLHRLFPENLNHARKLQDINRDDYEKFVVCSRCHSTYNYSDCVGKDGINKCTFVPFPRHKQKRMRTPCNHLLMKTIKTASGKHTTMPMKIFCYRSIIQTIKQCSGPYS